MAKGSEKQWVRELQPRLQAAMQPSVLSGMGVGVRTECRLAYAHEILQYSETDGEAPKTHRSSYATDLLIYDHAADGRHWVPRVVIECKLGSVTTHDALTYSSKAATHKHVHPYLRYGILIGDLRTCVPPRLMRHGAYFDFMAAWQKEAPDETEWSDLIDVLQQEIEASRSLQLLLTGKDRSCKQFRMIHRPLQLKPMQNTVVRPNIEVDDDDIA